ncbi:MAG: cryptochrome/photolyase family protein [candidate division KSB1 bacterium]|nr:cryptochrome/photolyase family protein [candidate division KSB1 bacterium]
MAGNYDSLVVIMGNQLYPSLEGLEPGNSLIFMAEDINLCRRYQYHKKKLVLILSAMRSYRDKLKTRYDIEYWRLDKDGRDMSYIDKLSSTVKSHHIRQVKCFEIPDQAPREMLKDCCRSLNVQLSFYDSPGFLTPDSEFKSERMQSFYIRQRKRLNLLIKDGKPVGGKWSFDKENRKALPKNIHVPKPSFPAQTDHTREIL